MKPTARPAIIFLCLLAILLYLMRKRFRPQRPRKSSARRLMPARPPMPTKEIVEDFSAADVENVYYSQVESVDGGCSQEMLMGNEDDGGYYVCNDPDYQPRRPCLVYSFGINYDFSFDDAVSSTYGCEVHSFDPSMTFLWEPKRPEQMFFHKVGLGDKDEVNSMGWTMRNLTSIKAKLNHTKINILKMDIESDEYKALPNIMAAGELQHVDQLVFELHILGMENTSRALEFMLHGLQLLRDLRDHGFYVFHSQQNEENFVTSPFTGLRRVTCHELSLVNDRKENLTDHGF